MNEEVKEEILTLVGRIESIEASMRMPVSADIHLVCVKEFLGEMKDALREISKEDK